MSCLDVEEFVTLLLQVGRTLRINLLAAYNMGGSTAKLDIFPLSEPGLPSGGVLSLTKFLSPFNAPLSLPLMYVGNIRWKLPREQTLLYRLLSIDVI
eukprot:763429-Hanusia_phi.AAC.8